MKRRAPAADGEPSRWRWASPYCAEISAAARQYACRREKLALRACNVITRRRNMLAAASHVNGLRPANFRVWWRLCVDACDISKAIFIAKRRSIVWPLNGDWAFDIDDVCVMWRGAGARKNINNRRHAKPRKAGHLTCWAPPSLSSRVSMAGVEAAFAARIRRHEDGGASRPTVVVSWRAIARYLEKCA